MLNYVDMENFYVQKSLDFVFVYYRDQLDKSNNLNILHPLTVGLELQKDSKSLVCGLLHDMIEDGFLSEEVLLQNFPEDYVDTLKILTRDKNESYARYIDRIIQSADPIAISIKIADLKHNLSRNDGKFPELYERHQKAYQRLKEYENNFSKC